MVTQIRKLPHSQIIVLVSLLNPRKNPSKSRYDTKFACSTILSYQFPANSTNPMLSHTIAGQVATIEIFQAVPVNVGTETGWDTNLSIV